MEDVKFYVVERDDETVDSIAAKYELSPSQLLSLNRLSSRVVFKGQKLRVSWAPRTQSVKKEEEEEEEDLFDGQFVRIRVSHVTDGRGIVQGSLLLTPKSFMFNPRLTDPLVLESRDEKNEPMPDRYQLISPMSLVAGVALFKDFIKLNSVRDGDAREEEDIMTGNGVHGDETRYLRFIIGVPEGKNLPKSTPVLAYGEQKLYPEYWFVVRGYKVDKLLEFFLQWFPDLYGAFSAEKIKEKGLNILPEGGIALESTPVVQRGALSKTITQTTFDLGLTIPRLIGSSKIFDDDLLKYISETLPPRTFGHDLNLIFSTVEHGFSLKNLYRKMPMSDEEPVLLLIMDTKDNVFGAYLSCPLRMTEHFAGTGESFLFRTNPGIEVFRWTGENDYILKGEMNSFVVGMSDGHFGLWLDGDLNLGRTQRCLTFNNNPLTSQDFHVQNLECWTFTL